MSASAAAWIRIGITIVTQIALVPLYLRTWKPEEYGAWLLMQATMSIMTAIDIGHHDYIGFECLRLGTSKRNEIAQTIFSAGPIALLITLIDIFIILVLIKSGVTESWLNHDVDLITNWQSALLLQAIIYLFTTSIGGLIIRGLTPFGHFPRIAWWGTIYAFITALVPGIAVYYGADLWEATIALCSANVVYYIIHLADMLRLMRLERLFYTRPVLKIGLRQGSKSLWLTLKGFAEMARQQGVRILLAPLASVADMAAFSTMRTGANFALQGLNTITRPIMPELMRYLVARDQQRAEGSFSVVWLVICVGLSPAVIIVQYLAPEFFPLWTHGKITYDPWIFGMLSLGVLFYALSQPAIAVIQGNNIVRIQLYISIIIALITLIGLFKLVPVYGIRGAAATLLLAELINIVSYLIIALRWLRENHMHWPWRAFLTGFTSIIVAGISMTALTIYPTERNTYLIYSQLAETLVILIYWYALPEIARRRTKNLLSRFLPKLKAKS